jgi:restriction endonuclease Mrr
VIPHDDEIQGELISYLLDRPGHRASASQCYEALAERFPSLTWDELHLKYQNSVSKWANRVQFARLHLVQSGHLYRAGEGPTPSPGVWILTPKALRV